MLSAANKDSLFQSFATTETSNLQVSKFFVVVLFFEDLLTREAPRPAATRTERGRVDDITS